MKPSRDLARLIEIMAALRTPGSGCPWDLEQNFQTIAPYTIEEAYEVADAIERGDLDDLKDELGDLLLQVVFHARMAEEQGSFAFGDVVQATAWSLLGQAYVVAYNTIRQNREGTGLRQVRRLCSSLRPRGRPQERVLTALPFLVAHGKELSDLVVDAADPFRLEHGVLEL
jgi:NTP pyrophosphatase (non-canonical NTP hydrolase)